MRALFLLPFMATFACADETLSGYADPETTYALAEVDGQIVDYIATLTFPTEGEIQGRAPCNKFVAAQTAPYPWFAMGGARITHRACPHLDRERAFLAALRDMTIAEVTGPVLILTNDDGREMIFNAQR